MTDAHLSGLAGVTIERRGALALPLLAGAAALRPARPAVAGTTQAEETALAFDALVARAGQLAGAHLDGGRVNAEAYLAQLEALGARLDADTLPEAALGAFGGYDPPVEVGVAARALPVLVVLWRLAPGAVLPPHNHTPGYVFSLCLEGACRVRHFEVSPDAPAPGTPGAFTLRATHARLLRPGLGTTLTGARDNVHTFEAGPAGALGIDVNTFLPGEGDWSMISADPVERDGFDEVARARWIGKP